MRPEEFARDVIEKYVNKTGNIEVPEAFSDVDINKAGAFVSIKTLEGDLRGCIGTINPTMDNVVEEVMRNAVSAASHDPRFTPVESHELSDLMYSVDILHEPEPVTNFNQLDPLLYGIMVSAMDNNKKALLLPDLEGLDTVEKQVTACMEKAGINRNESVKIQRFKVDRYSE